MRLSIIAACHSKTPFFAEMLESFLQSGCITRETEFLICDDASPNGGDGDTAREYARRYPDVFRVIRNDSHLPIADSYQRLCDLASGDYIMPFDSDDIFVPFNVAAAMDFLDEHQEYCASYGKKRLFNDQAGDMGQNHGGEHSLFAITIDPRITHNAMLIRAEDLKAAGGYHPTIFKQYYNTLPDVMMWIGIGLKKNLFFDNTLRAFYRRHSGQNTEILQKDYSTNYHRMRIDLTGAYPEVYDAIINHKPIQITPELRFPTVALLGAAWVEESANGGNTGKMLAYCDAAQTLMPDDYGIREYRMKVLMAQQRYGEVLSQAALMALEHAGELYVEQLAMGWAVDAAEKLNIPSQEFQQRRIALLKKLFSMTGEQQQLFQRTIDNFLKK